MLEARMNLSLRLHNRLSPTTTGKESTRFNMTGKHTAPRNPHCPSRATGSGASLDNGQCHRPLFQATASGCAGAAANRAAIEAAKAAGKAAGRSAVLRGASASTTVGLLIIGVSDLIGGATWLNEKWATEKAHSEECDFMQRLANTHARAAEFSQGLGSGACKRACECK